MNYFNYLSLGERIDDKNEDPKNNKKNFSS